MHTTLILHAYERRLRNSRIPAVQQARVYTMLKESIADLRARSKASRIGASPTAQRLIERVALAAEVTGDQLRNDTKGPGLQARLLAMHLLRERKYGFAEIGHYFERDHTTVMRSVRVVQERLDTCDFIMVRLFNKYKTIV